MSVILRISGRDLDPDLIARKTTLPITHIYRRGESRFPNSKPRGPKHKFSGVNIQITRKDGLRARASNLIPKAAKIIGTHRQELRRIARMSGVDFAILDIGVAKLDVAGQFERIPATFLRELGQLGIDLEISIYHAFA
jgi:hypothetical protein